MKRTTILTTFCMTIAFISLHAQCIEKNGKFESILGGRCINTIITAVPFLRIVPDARSGAMGDAGIAVSADAAAMHFNASKLAFSSKKMGIVGTYTPRLRSFFNLNDIFLAHLSGFYKINKKQAVGIAFRYFSLGEIQFTNAQGQPTVVGSPNEYEIALAYSRQIIPNRLSMGLTGKYIYSNLAAGQIVGGENVTAGITGAADLSFTYKSPGDLKTKKSGFTFGLVFSNIGSKISYTNSINKDYIPANLGLGGAWEFIINDKSKLTVAVDINKLLVPTPCLGNDCDTDANGVPDYKELSVARSLFSSFGDAPNGFSEEMEEIMNSIGLEYWHNEHFAIRAGYFREAVTKGNRNYWTVGLGLKYNIFGLNLSYLAPINKQRNPLDNTLAVFSAIRCGLV